MNYRGAWRWWTSRWLTRRWGTRSGTLAVSYGLILVEEEDASPTMAFILRAGGYVAAIAAPAL